MRGISEERLKKLLVGHGGALVDVLILACEELNEWKPIETAPRGKRLRLFHSGLLGNGQTEGKIYLETDRKYFTHWQEVPADPE